MDLERKCSLQEVTKGLTIFIEVVTYFSECNIPLKNIIACATDGAPSMIGRYNGFIAHLKKGCTRNILHTLPNTSSALSCKMFGWTFARRP